MSTQNDANRDIANHVLSGSTTMIGVCITVITLFRVMHIDFQTYADELLAFDNIIFITAAILAYSAIRRQNSRRLERAADITFLSGMLLMLVSGIMIIFSS